MIRIFLLFLCVYNIIIKATFAYPSWFHHYVEEHDKKYTDEEMQVAFNILKPKYDHIRKNTGDLHLRLHKNSDQNRKSGRRLHELIKRSKSTPRQKKKTLNLPLTFDWRVHGSVTDVEAQGACGGCYCFSAIHNLEHWYYKKKNTLTKLSVQECIDCTTKKIQGSDGCDGGLMEDVFELAKTWKIGKATYDPFVQRNSVCPLIQPSHGIRVKSYQVMSDEFSDKIENHLAHNLLQYGPIPVGIDSSSYNVELYRSGIIKADHCGKNIDHAVTVVGYGIEENTRFWIVKNSWGKHWGEDGYFRLERDHNACGINSYSSFVTDVEVV